MPALEQEISTGAYTSPSLTTIWLGTNDAVLVNGSNSEMHVPIDEYKANVDEIVRKFQIAAPEADILMITPTHIDDDARIKYAADRTDEKKGMVDRSNAAMGDYARACVEVAELLKVPILDLYEHFNAQSPESRNTLLADGIHFNVAGNKAVYEQFRSKLKSDFPEVMSALDVWQFPSASKYVKEDPWTEANATTNAAQ
ncbi:GDSL esterase/lipase [Phytophthora citrophthora]|nr:GDSL esterase/lipase [Phytophthora citrophthora]